MSHRDKRKEQQQRDDLIGEQAAGDAGQVMFACLFITIWTADTFIFQYTTFLNQYVPPVIRVSERDPALLWSSDAQHKK